MLTLEERISIAPERTWLEFVEEEQDSVQRQINSMQFANPNAQHRAYLNALCTNLVETWIRDDLEITEPVYPWPQANQLASLWDIVNGTVLCVGTTRIALIPSDHLNVDELVVPQEWVDIPGWAADYYIALQVNSEEQWVQILGYTNHATLKSKGRFDGSDRTYCLNESTLIHDLTILWMGRELAPNPKPVVSPIVELSARSADALLNQLSRMTQYSPRLEVPFDQWAAFITDPAQRQELHTQRTTANSPSQSAATPVMLMSGWIQTVLDSGWELVQEAISPPQVAYARGSQDAISFKKDVILNDCKFELYRTYEQDRTKQDDANVSILIEIHVSAELTALPDMLSVRLLIDAGDGEFSSAIPPATIPASLPRRVLKLPTLFGALGEPYQIELSMGEAQIVIDAQVPEQF